jgi:hypothetical protein
MTSLGNVTTQRFGKRYSGIAMLTRKKICFVEGVSRPGGNLVAQLFSDFRAADRQWFYGAELYRLYRKRKRGDWSRRL